jgi:ketosteroid isomerase-like protein
MATEQTKRKELYQRWFDALAARDLSRLDELAEAWIAEDFVTHDPDFPDWARGPGGIKAFAHQLVANNSHIHVTIEDFFGDGDKTAVRFTVRRTNAATGKTTSFEVLAIDHWSGDQLVEEWELAGPPEEQA